MQNQTNNKKVIYGILSQLILALALTGCGKKTVKNTVQSTDPNPETSNFEGSGAAGIDLSKNKFLQKLFLINPATGLAPTGTVGITIQILGAGGSCVALEESHSALTPYPQTGEIKLFIGEPTKRTEGDLGLTIEGVFSTLSQLANRPDLFIPGKFYDASRFSSSCTSELIALGTRRLRVSVLDGDSSYSLTDLIIQTQGADGTGAPVNSGSTGAQGDIGATGEAGTNGANGTKGDKGDQGVPGQDGLNGTDGQDGADGVDAPAGVCTKTIQKTPCGAGAFTLGTRVIKSRLNCNYTRASITHPIVYSPATVQGYSLIGTESLVYSSGSYLAGTAKCNYGEYLCCK